MLMPQSSKSAQRSDVELVVKICLSLPCRYLKYLRTVTLIYMCIRCMDVYVYLNVYDYLYTHAHLYLYVYDYINIHVHMLFGARPSHIGVTIFADSAT